LIFKKSKTAFYIVRFLRQLPNYIYRKKVNSRILA
jgi:hypothetical protein